MPKKDVFFTDNFILLGISAKQFRTSLYYIETSFSKKHIFYQLVLTHLLILRLFTHMNWNLILNNKQQQSIHRTPALSK